MRSASCPICGGPTRRILSLDLGARPPLPSEIEIRSCERDSFAFNATGAASDYDAYYAKVANDTWHREVEGPDDPAVEQAAILRKLIGDMPTRVLDYGCGSGDLLAALAKDSPNSRFVGCDVSAPALADARRRSSDLANVTFLPLQELSGAGEFDLVIVSHVLEHLIEFDILERLADALADDGLLYVEVPDALRYEARPRREYLYYFDRLHVNHFTPQALAAVAAPYGFAYVSHSGRDFRYRDGAPYPAVGALFRKGWQTSGPVSPDLGAGLARYIQGEQRRFKKVAGEISKLPGLLVWGAGENFHRGVSEGGPLSGARAMRLLDRRSFDLTVGGKAYATEVPQEVIPACAWPVAITISEFRPEIEATVRGLDPARIIYSI